MRKKLLRLNLGCGGNKIPGYINVDAELSCKPDIVINFITEKLPYKSGCVAEVLLFHTIEHINKKLHYSVLSEIYRVLAPGGRLIISYPEFTKCYKNWETNYKGMKEFWEATLYGRQLYPTDLHVCIMHTPDFRLVLKECGFNVMKIVAEPNEGYNTVISAVKGKRFIPYEEMLKNDMASFSIKRVTLNDKKRNSRHNSRKSS